MQTRTRPASKWRRILGALADGRRLARFDAEQLGDHCLHTTIAALEARGVRILRDPAVFQGRFGLIHCRRYRLDRSSLQRARKLLEVGP